MKFLLLNIFVALVCFLTKSHFSLHVKNMKENCANAIDDDGDGLIDLNDPDCECPILEPVSLIPNPSFEEMNCCPTNRSMLNCAGTWIQASEPTTDYIHTCGWMGWEEFPPPRPFPDGNGIMGFRDGRVFQDNTEPTWKEYAGACLLSPLKKNQTYRFEFYVGFVDNVRSPAIDITFFGSTDCANLPFGVGNQELGCPTNGPGWQKLGSVLVSGHNRWIKTAITVVPKQDIQAIAIGPSCMEIQASQSIYYFFDNLVLADLKSFEFQIAETDHPCSDDFLLEVPFEEDLDYQWYQNGIALLGENESRLKIFYGEGDYQVRILSETDCKITKSYSYVKPILETTIQPVICENESYSISNRILDMSGVYYDTLTSVENCDSIVKIELRILGKLEDSLQIKIFEGESYQVGDERIVHKGQHAVSLTSKHGCDSLVVVDLSYYNLYVPDAFTPNGDGINDFFNIAPSSELVAIKNFKVYDRWGNKIFQADQLTPGLSDSGWDGTQGGTMVESGVYVFVTEIIMGDGIERKFAGSIMLIR